MISVGKFRHYFPNNQEKGGNLSISVIDTWYRDFFSHGVEGYQCSEQGLARGYRQRDVIYTDTSPCSTKLEASYRIDQHWQLTTNHSLLHMVHPVVAAPKYKGFLGGHFNYCHWTAIVGVQYLGGLYTEVGTNEQKKNVCLVNVSLSYAVTKNIGLWVRGENLLAQRYELNLGYPMPRATFMGGMNITL